MRGMVALGVCGALWFSAIAAADVVILKDGRKLEGEVVDKGDKISVKTKFGAIEIDRKDILKIEVGPRDEYKKRTATLKDSDAEGHYQLGLWCKQNKLPAEMEIEFKKAVEANPGHAGAHEGLGHMKVGDRWAAPLELRDSANALFKLGEADKAAKIYAAIAGSSGVAAMDRADATDRLARCQIRGGHADEAMKTYERLATQVAEAEQPRVRAKLAVLRACPDGRLSLDKTEASASDLFKEEDQEPLQEGAQPLWDLRVMEIGLRHEADREVKQGRDLMEQARVTAQSDKYKGLAKYEDADDHFQKANAIVPDRARSFQIECVRTMSEDLKFLTDQAIKNADENNPFRFQYRFDPDGRFSQASQLEYDKHRREWNNWATQAEQNLGRIQKLQNRFPDEFKQDLAFITRVKDYVSDAIPRIRKQIDETRKKLR